MKTFLTDQFTKFQTKLKTKILALPMKKKNLNFEKRKFCCKKFCDNYARLSMKLNWIPQQKKVSERMKKCLRIMKNNMIRKARSCHFLKFCPSLLSENQSLSRDHLNKKQFLGGRELDQTAINATYYRIKFIIFIYYLCF